MISLPISDDSWLDASNLGLGVFAPLKGFLNEAEYRSVVTDCSLPGGKPWTLPITLDAPEALLPELKRSETVALTIGGSAVAELTVTDVFKADFDHDLPKIFGVSTLEHPGVKKESSRSPFRVSGPVKMLRLEPHFESAQHLTPERTREAFRKAGWKTVTGFQTRNPIHRAHEHLQRIALEITDGLFIQPLVGWKRAGDFTMEAVLGGYRAMLDSFYPAEKVLFGTLRTAMRYAGPREAVFHALVRKNYGCTHFVVGRDHAGVGGYYGKYEAQALCKKLAPLGIEVLALGGPFYCRKCLGVVTERTCAHKAPDTFEISGTLIREMLVAGKVPPPEYMRAEVAQALIPLAQAGKLFF